MTRSDPDEYRMSLGEHLEELRRRLMYAIGGLIVAVAICTLFSQHVIAFFCRPLTDALVEQQINPQLIYTSAGDPFTVYLKITLISGAVIAAPWIIWQLWLFVAAGLYPNERKAIWRYAPLSIALLIAGTIFCYTVVFPTTLRFFFSFGNAMALQLPTTNVSAPAGDALPTTIPSLPGDPASLQPFQTWFNTAQQRLKFALPDSAGQLHKMVIQYGPESLVTPFIALPDYIDMVLLWLLIFGLAFQLPLVTMAIARVGVVSVQDLARFRRYVYMILAIISAVLMPDIFSGTLALMVPLCLLYEFGLLLARMQPKAAADETSGT